MIVILRHAAGSGVLAEFLRDGDMQVCATGAGDGVHTLSRAAQVERRHGGGFACMNGHRAMPTLSLVVPKTESAACV